MEDEMTMIEAEIQKWEAQDKTSEYIEQMKQVEDEINCECKKTIAEMKKMQKAKEKIEKNIENKIEELKKLNEKAKELGLNKRIKEAQRLKADVHEMKEELKAQTENDIEKLIKADDSLTENDAQGLLKGVKLLTKEEIKLLLEVIAGKSGDDKKELLEAVKSLTENEIKIMQDQAKSIKLERVRQWEEYYMKIACLAALRSKDPSTPVGACIVDTESYQIVGIGYNSMPYVEGGHNDKIFPWKGSEIITPDKYEDSKLKYPFVVHAAVNAITNRTKDKLDGCTLYTTIHPDEDCARAIQQAGIKEVVYCMYTRKEERIMKSDMDRSKKIFKANKIETREMTISNENEPVTTLDDRIKKAKNLHVHKGLEDTQLKEAYKDAISWEDFFIGIATLSKKRPGQYDRKQGSPAGACIVSLSKQVMAVGYSGYPENMELEEIEQEEDHGEYIAHAEYKAIIGGPIVRGCTLYVTSYPCNVCARLIVQSGISTIMYNNDKGYPNSREILKHCLESKNKIHVRKFIPENKTFIDSLNK